MWNCLYMHFRTICDSCDLCYHGSMGNSQTTMIRMLNLIHTKSPAFHIDYTIHTQVHVHPQCRHPIWTSRSDHGAIMIRILMTVYLRCGFEISTQEIIKGQSSLTRRGWSASGTASRTVSPCICCHYCVCVFGIHNVPIDYVMSLLWPQFPILIVYVYLHEDSEQLVVQFGTHCLSKSLIKMETHSLFSI